MAIKYTKLALQGFRSFRVKQCEMALPENRAPQNPFELSFELSFGVYPNVQTGPNVDKASAISRLSATWIPWIDVMAPAARLLAPRHDRRLDRLELSLPGARWGTGEVLIHSTLRCHQTWPYMAMENRGKSPYKWRF